ncbi:MAG: anaerobic ribonucleoside-triphosphate reductase activating protein [Oscillospiraceae bacterium]|jgi:anaerobic ribonucleoside-triphosphate reductase activating protein|nr:anaerobic ribonucleoside-triphosphate reductase activating protein [Oscillospiraceae bacterium]
MLRISGIVDESVVDGPGYRYVVFAQGCPHHCPGCHNPHTHAFEGGTSISAEELFRNVRKNPLLSGVTLSGGEPFCQAEELAALAGMVKAAGLSVITYTGYTFEELIADFSENPGWRSLLENTDILVDGPFRLEEKDPLLKFRGSKNQRLINVKESLENGEAVLVDS